MLILAVLVLCLLLVRRRHRYRSSEYYKQTRTPLAQVRKDKGSSGELDLYWKLRRLKGARRFLFNLYVPADHGETTEIDALLLCESGIYVLESKNYTGRICGTEYQRCWTQTLPGREVRSFYNPILQNSGHIRWLHAYLQDRQLPIYSFVVFGSGCTLGRIELTDDRHHVVKLRKARRAIRRHGARVGQQLRPAEIERLYRRLYPLTQADEQTKAQHIEDVRKKRKRHGRCWLVRLLRRLFHRRRCPRCGARLVIRRAQKGENAGHRFLGCSNYPSCYYTQDL